MNYIEEKIKEFKEKIFWNVEGDNEMQEIVDEMRKLLEDCQKRERERVVEMIKEDIEAPLLDRDDGIEDFYDGFFKAIEKVIKHIENLK